MTTKSFPYDNSQYTTHEYNSVQAGGGSGTSYVALSIPTAANVFSVSATVLKANSAPGGNISLYHISANNGSNTYSNTFVANVAVMANLVGNAVSTGALVSAGNGLGFNPYDVLLAVTDGAANATVALTTEYTIAPSANVTA